MNKLKDKLMGKTTPTEDAIEQSTLVSMTLVDVKAMQEFESLKTDLEAELDGFEEDLEEFTVDTADDLTLVADVTAVCKGHTKKLAALQKSILAPIAREEERVRGMFRGVTSRLSKLEASLKAKIGAYDMRQRAERSRALSEAQTAALAGDQQTTERALALASVSKTEKVDGLKIRYTIDIEIEDEDLVPDEWWVIDEARIGKYARATNGEVEIPGVVYHKRPIISSTSK